ncbi:RNA polymerase subunit 8-like protein [Encephalitozoon intestinalis ATCC 50506]|uniref:RNA polymerase subunit 8-like protein n=1 Tax=Encephalitozoon intestinalis (strain ATCC 50506) TaxID=876142 RepID=E0S807_ENCIT|nr:RNA polymerase subunit 8-like protein [Encephalitozoon intestinalis ATCC 50506]ADM11842.1 RNA polymerase subunit 8-like protein [Encephalitozoon intestinalis ATCC 50506]UTX45592.1 RNA polymerase [Encephalitozoon intestinalis]
MQILADSFKVVDIDKEGKLYTKVSRLYMESPKISISLDYNTTLCRLQVGHAVEVRIFRGIHENIDCFYLAYGRVYSLERKGPRTIVRVSLGGLLLIIDAPEEVTRGLGDKDDISLALTFVL